MNALLYATGVATGVLLMAVNRYSIRKAVDMERSRGEALRKENQALRDDLSALMQANDCRMARRQGFEDGRKSPLNEAERMVAAFGGRSVDIRGRRSA